MSLKFSLRPFTVYYHINSVIQVFKQPLDSHTRDMKRPKDYAVHAQSQGKSHYLASLKITLSKTMSVS